MKHKCSYCGKVKAVKYRGPCIDEFFCSKNCVLGMSGVVNIADGKCATCGKTLSGQHGMFTTTTKILISCRDSIGRLPEMYCSEECLIRSTGCLTIDEWDKTCQCVNQEQDNATDN